MVRRTPSLASIKRQIAIEKSKVFKATERSRLESELRQLRRSGRTDVAGRIGRGLVIIGKKTGKVVLKQAQLMRERQIREAKRTKKRGRGGLTGRDDMFAPLDF